MTESATRKPWLTLRRVIAGAVLLVLVLAVAGLVFGVFRSADPVKVTFLRFEGSDDGVSTVAVLRLTNEMNQTIRFLPVGGEVSLGRFVSRRGTGDVVWTKEFPRNLTVIERLSPPFILPHSEATQRVWLPDDGRTGHVGVYCLPPPRNIPKFLRFAPSLWRIAVLRLKPRWCDCDQEIQCPLRRPDDTVEPARLLPKGEGKAP